jgi:hypothetical protein
VSTPPQLAGSCENAKRSGSRAELPKVPSAAARRGTAVLRWQTGGAGRTTNAAMPIFARSAACVFAAAAVGDGRDERLGAADERAPRRGG